MAEIGYADQVAQLKPKYAIADQLEHLRDILTAVHQHEGYPNAKVSYEIIPDAQGTSVDVQYRVEAGTPIRVAEVALEGVPGELTAPPLPDAPVSLPRVNQFIEQLLNLLRDEGYLFAGISANHDPETRRLTLNVESGPRTAISKLSYEGLVRIEHRVARKYTALAVGMPYRDTDVNATKRSLLSSGLFSRVEVVPEDGGLDSPKEAITIRVTERPLQTLEVGGGANSELGIHVCGEAVDKQFFGDGQSIALRLDSYFDQVQANSGIAGNSISQGFSSLRYLNPKFMGSYLVFTEEFRFQRQELATQEFDQDRLSASTYWFKQFSSGRSLFAGHTLLQDTVDNVSPDAVISDLDTGSVRLSFLGATANLDRRNDPLLPKSGYTFTLEPRLASRVIGSEADYASITARATTIIPFDPVVSGFSLGLGLRGGVAQPFGSTEEIPITQRFYLGGRTSVRGFRENSLGPRGDQGSVIGGDTLVMGSSQLQYLLGNSVSTHLFLDAGTVYLRERSISPSDLRYSTGVGFQYLSPIGPVGIDVGHPLNERDGEPSFRLHFSVGSTF
jgi:outer membrane protein insertion porin family